ncbi:hypothetical protein PG985_004607 [Apiospora marii]|uniref:uncharacterized protein n=1 Tax=Apiospora marii TaxID=335849 RepID=UPI00312EB137
MDDKVQKVLDDLDRRNKENERTKQERLQEWEEVKGQSREWRERIERDVWDLEAWTNDRWARQTFGGLYTAEFFPEPDTTEYQGEEDPAKRTSPSASRQQTKDVTKEKQAEKQTKKQTKKQAKKQAKKPTKKQARKDHGLGDVYHPPMPHRRPYFAWIDKPTWRVDSRQLLSQLHQSWSPWYSSLDTGSPALNGLHLAGALALLVYYRRGVRSVLKTSAQLLYVVLWLVAVLVSEAERLVVDALSRVVGLVAGLLYRVARGYVVLPIARWLGRMLRDIVHGVAAAVAVSWLVYATWLVLRRIVSVYLAGAAALVGGVWALQAYVVGPIARPVSERVGPRVYWVAVAIFAIWAAYGAMWTASRTGSLWWWFTAASTHSETPPLSFSEMSKLDPELDLGHVVVRTVRDALGAHIDERLFAFFGAGQWEKRFMDWFVDRGYVLRPCQYPGCVIPDAEW